MVVKDKIVVMLPLSWDEKPQWYRKFVTSIEWKIDQYGDYPHDALVQWFKNKYNAELYLQESCIWFPDKETYTQCVLTWS